MRKNGLNNPINKRFIFVCFLLIIAMLSAGCNGNDEETEYIIPTTQQQKYAVPPYVDYSFSGSPEFVDDISLCSDPEKQYVLPDGYLYGCEPIPIYSVTNQLTISTDESGGIFNGCGYQDGARIRGVLEIGDSDFSFVTGFLPIKKGDTVFFNRYCFDPGHQGAAAMNIAFYNAERQSVASTSMSNALENAFEVVETDADGHITSLKVRDDLTGNDIAYVRFTLIGYGKDVIISVNEPFVPSGYQYGWARLNEYIPKDWYTEIKATVDAVNRIDLKDENNVISFLFASDIHLDPYSESSYTEHLGKVSAAVMNECDIPFFVTGGDNCTQSSGFMPSDFAPNMKELLVQLSPIPQKNILLSVGNHDGATGMAYNQYGEKVHYCFQLNNEQ